MYICRPKGSGFGGVEIAVQYVYAIIVAQISEFRKVRLCPKIAVLKPIRRKILTASVGFELHKTDHWRWLIKY